MYSQVVNFGGFTVRGWPLHLVPAVLCWQEIAELLPYRWSPTNPYSKNERDFVKELMPVPKWYTPSYHAAFSSPDQLVITTPTGPLHFSKTRSNTFTLWLKPRVACRAWTCEKLRKARSNAPENSSPKSRQIK